MAKLSSGEPGVVGSSPGVSTSPLTFQGTDDGPVRKYVGLYVSRSPDLKTTHISQEPLIRELLERSGMQHCTPVLSPMEPGTLLKTSDRPAVPDPKRRQEYQEHVGSLLYLSVYTRPDLCFAVNQLAKHMSNPGEVHWTALRRCLRYLKGTATFGITYKSDDTNPDTLTAYADADWAACTETRRSYMGYLFMLACRRRSGVEILPIQGSDHFNRRIRIRQRQQSV